MKTPSAVALTFGLALALIFGVATFSSSRSLSSRVGTSENHRYLQSGIKCGCSSCSWDVWQTQAPFGAGDAFTCGARVMVLKQEHDSMTACRMVATQYPDECGACNPEMCEQNGHATQTNRRAVEEASIYEISIQQAPEVDVTLQDTTSLTLPTITYMGNNGQAGVFPLGKCQGDCDSDAECMPGLICFHRGPMEPIPGCSGNDDLGYDYCIEPPNTPAPTVLAPQYFDESISTVSPETLDNPGIGSGSVDVEDDYHSNDDQGASNDDNGDGQYTVSDAFLLKMYWQEGYNWQEEPFERKWCMRCDSSREECAPGRGVYITNCDEGEPTEWEFLTMSDGRFLVRMTAADLCLQANGRSRITVEPCDTTLTDQKWRAVNGLAEWNNRFELRVDSNPNDCVTQQHHPREGEFLFLYPCSLPQSDFTNFWNMY